MDDDLIINEEDIKVDFDNNSNNSSINDRENV